MGCCVDDIDVLLFQVLASEHAPRHRVSRDMVPWRLHLTALITLHHNALHLSGGHHWPRASRCAAENARRHSRALSGLIASELIDALIDLRAVLVMASLATLCYGPGRQSWLQPRRSCFVRGAWARIQAEAHASAIILKRGSLVHMLFAYAVGPP